MRLASTIFTLATVSAVAPAQSPTFSTHTDLSVFAQVDGKTPAYDTHKSGTAITVANVRKLRADAIHNNATIVHTRAKATLRTLGRHSVCVCVCVCPCVRIRACVCV